MRDRLHAVCRSCWRRLPDDLRAGVLSARAAKAPHLRAKAEMRATAWLAEQSPALEAARRVGEEL